jgi:hypothetical protein
VSSKVDVEAGQGEITKIRETKARRGEEKGEGEERKPAERRKWRTHDAKGT